VRVFRELAEPLEPRTGEPGEPRPAIPTSPAPAIPTSPAPASSTLPAIIEVNVELEVRIGASSTFPEGARRA